MITAAVDGIARLTTEGPLMTTDSGGTVVARDMERVFLRLSDLPPAAPKPQADALTRPWRNRLGIRRAIRVALMVAVLVIGSIIVFLRLAGQLANAPPQAAPAPFRPAPSETIVREPPAPVVAPPARVVPQSVPADTTTPASPVRMEKKPEPKAKVIRKTPLRAGTPAPVASASPPDMLSCERASDREACFYQNVLKADRRMRQVYDRAVSARVPVSDLVRARKAWKTALSRSRKEPSASIKTLDVLTADLSGRIGATSSLPK